MSDEAPPVPPIDAALIRRLVAAQFPQWADLLVERVLPGGWNNRMFRLGEHMAVRLPSAAHYAGQVRREQRWLPALAPHLPLPIPVPLAMGEPGEGFPWPWSVYGWIDGKTAAAGRVDDLARLATDLGGFLAALHRIDAADGPPPGSRNFWRGGPLATYDAETRWALAALEGRIDTPAATAIWDAALAAAWCGPPVWLHGDVAADNLIVTEGRLSAVIDFGSMAVGDPACDLGIAWTLFEGESRTAFRRALPLDAETWARGRGWVLWKALIVVAGYPGTDPLRIPQWRRVLDDLLA